MLRSLSTLLALSFLTRIHAFPTANSASSAFNLEPVGEFAHPQGPVAELTNPVLYTCQTANCASCTAYLLTNLGYSNCYWAGPFISVALMAPQNGLDGLHCADHGRHTTVYRCRSALM